MYKVYQIFRPVKCALFHRRHVRCSAITQEQQVSQETIYELNLCFRKNSFKFSIAKIAFHFYKIRNRILIDMNNTDIQTP